MALSKFGQFMAVTRERTLTGPDQLINDATQNSYLLGIMLRKNKERVIRGGSRITERVQLRDAGTFAFYSPGDPRSPTAQDTIEILQWAWRFCESNAPYTDAEVMLNEGQDELSKFKSYRKVLRSGLDTAHWNGLERALWSQPNEANMESLTSSPGTIFSIPCYITEASTFLPPGWAGGTVAQLAPATNPEWRNKQATYTPADPFNARTGIIPAFDDAFRQILYVEPPGAHFQNDNLSDVMVCTNRDGANMYEQAIRISNDYLRGGGGAGDPHYGRVFYKGAPIIYIARLDTEELDQAAGAYTNQPYPPGSPRYFVINCKYLYPVFHSGRVMMEKGPVEGGVEHHDTETLFKISWLNLPCASRRRHALIHPA